MRHLTPATEAQTQIRLGTEPLIIIKVEWISGVKWYGYKTMAGIEGRITSFDSINAQIGNKALGNVESASVSLSDTDGVIKTYFDMYEIVGRHVTVYNYYEGTSLSDATPILVGRINTPIDWDEANRTLTFTVFNDADDEDVLLEIKETSNDFPNEDSIGITIPMCFGTVLRLPAVRIDRSLVGTLKGYVSSYTSWYSNNPSAKITIFDAKFYIEGFESIDPSRYFTVEVANTLFRGHMSASNNQDFIVTEAGMNVDYPLTVVNNRPSSDVDYKNPACCWISDPTVNMVGKKVHFRFSRAYKYIEYKVDSKTYTEPIPEGTEHLDLKTGSQVTTQTANQYEDFICAITSQNGTKIFFNRPCVDQYGRDVLLGELGDNMVHVVGQTEYRWKQLPDINDPLRWVIGPGAEVTIYNDPTALYCVNSVPSEEILEILCERQGLLSIVPSNYYTKHLDYTVNINGKTEHITAIEFNDWFYNQSEGWSTNNVYVSLKSTVHSNTATDVISWLALNRTSLTTDAVSFGDVGTAVTNYPSHFAILSQRGALQAIGEVSWQARIGTMIDAGVLYIKYLSVEEAPIYSLDTSNIKMDTLKLSKSNSDEVYTKIQGMWNKSYDEEKPYKETIYQNEDLYTKQDFDIDFTIYNIKSLVIKSLTFWANRLSNSWYLLQADTFLTGLAVQIWDTVEVTVPFLNGGDPINCIVQNITKADETISLGLWVPLNNTGDPAYLDDSDDTLPADPSTGIFELDYIIPQYRTTRLHYEFNPHAMRSDGKVDSTLYQLDFNNADKTRQTITKFKITEIHDNYLVCIRTDKKSDNDDNSVSVKVAMPESLRRITWDDKSINNTTYTWISTQHRKAVGTTDLDDTAIQEEIITPLYANGQTIEAMYKPDGSGIIEDGKICWVDCNVDGRAWAKEKNLDA